MYTCFHPHCKSVPTKNTVEGEINNIHSLIVLTYSNIVCCYIYAISGFKTVFSSEWFFLQNLHDNKLSFKNCALSFAAFRFKESFNVKHQIMSSSKITTFVILLKNGPDKCSCYILYAEIYVTRFPFMQDVVMVMINKDLFHDWHHD